MLNLYLGALHQFQASDARALRIKFDVLSRTLRLSDGMGVAAADRSLCTASNSLSQSVYGGRIFTRLSAKSMVVLVYFLLLSVSR